MTTPAAASDDLLRQSTLVDPDDEKLVHLAIGAQTYTVLLGGGDTAGRFALIDMLMPPGAAAPPHRHDFEETFHVLDGAIEVNVRGQTATATAGQTVNIPALAPHTWRNPGSSTIRTLCLVAPAGLERYFAEFGEPVASRTSPPPQLTDAELAERRQKSIDIGPKYAIEVVGADSLGGSSSHA